MRLICLLIVCVLLGACKSTQQLTTEELHTIKASQVVESSLTIPGPRNDKSDVKCRGRGLFRFCLPKFKTEEPKHVVYGLDQIVSPRLSGLGERFLSLADAMPLMVHMSFLHNNKNDVSALIGMTTETDKSALLTDSFCPEVLSYQSNQLGSCSGFMLDNTTLVTAGHCLLDSVSDKGLFNSREHPSCRHSKWVFGYSDQSINEFGKVGISKADVYNCGRILVAFNSERIDLAFIELERPRKFKNKFELSALIPKVGDILNAMGYPNGSPLKAVTGGAITKVEAMSFKATLDMLGGNSGSPALNRNNKVAGMLVSGANDFVWDEERGCYQHNVCSEDTGACTDSSNSKGETFIWWGVIKYYYDFVKWFLQNEKALENHSAEDIRALYETR
ncbi:MAG: trypsin-like serine protease [Alteromonadaceae bacterium]|nr:trypsin-like serine protease [Alteromonadaceae bacterium]